MNKAICTFAMFASVAVTTAPTQAKVLMFLMGGQSNMAGVGAYPGEPGYPADVPCPSPYNKPQTAVKFWNYSPDPITNGAYWPGTGTGWIDLQPGYGWQPGEFGPEVSFGHRLRQLYPNDEIYLVKEGISSQPMATSWNPDGGAIYNQFHARVAAAVADLRAAGKSPQLGGMIWMQGETDTYGGPNNGADWSAAYAANLANLITTVRNKDKFGDFAVSDMPFVVGRITTYFGAADHNTTVRTAQMTIPPLVGHAAWINTDNLQCIYGGHYGTQGQIDLGIRFADAVHQLPEPSSLVMALTAMLAALACWRQRKRDSA